MALEVANRLVAARGQAGLWDKGAAGESSPVQSMKRLCSLIGAVVTEICSRDKAAWRSRHTRACEKRRVARMVRLVWPPAICPVSDLVLNLNRTLVRLCHGGLGGRWVQGT